MKFGQAWSMAMNLAWTMLFSLLIPLLVGIWADKKLGTTPLFILVGALLGILAATVGVARIALREFSAVAGQEPEQDAGAIGEEEPE